MSTVSYSEHTNFKIHPKLFALYLGMGSMIMFFAALSSALISKRGDFAHWVFVPLPSVFLYSTLVILLSSLTIHFAYIHLTKNSLYFYLGSLSTLILGILFLFLQIQGWEDLKSKSILLSGNPSGSYIYIISGFHGFHYIGGLVCLLILILIFYNSKSTKESQVLHFKMLTQYWHFIGFVWVYIYLFFKFIIYN